MTRQKTLTIFLGSTWDLQSCLRLRVPATTVDGWRPAPNDRCLSHKLNIVLSARMSKLMMPREKNDSIISYIGIVVILLESDQVGLTFICIMLYIYNMYAYIYIYMCVYYQIEFKGSFSPFETSRFDGLVCSCCKESVLLSLSLSLSLSSMFKQDMDWLMTFKK